MVGSCNHNYEFTQGYFYCTKCGHKTYGRSYQKKHRKKIGIGISTFLIIGIIGVMFVNGVFEINEKNLNNSIQNIPQNIQETANIVRDIATKTSETLQDTISEQIETVPKSQPISTQKETDESIVKSPPTITKKSNKELVQFALEQINEDRTKNNLNPVILSHNTAAQIHAEDVLAQRTISHWMQNGEKPYMTYSRLGGTGYVSQNVGFSGFTNLEECKRQYVICEKTDPIDSIKKSQYSMMYDDASSNWGHRDNILRPDHTHVSLGIAYDDYTFVFVENFEDNYLVSNSPISVTGNHVTIDSNLKSGKIKNIGIFYDPLPTHDLYLQHRNDGSYGLGDNIAVIVTPPPPNSYYDQPSGYKLIEANGWNDRDNYVLIDFDLSSVFTKPGVYTIGVWVDEDRESFMVTSYSIFYKG